jgi:hypothetical protein
MSKVVRYESSFESGLLKNIIYCFPDLAIFVQKIIEVTSLEELHKNIVECDVIIIDENVFLIANDVNKLYSLIEVLDSYKTIYEKNNTELVEIINVERLQNMEEEKNRRL